MRPYGRREGRWRREKKSPENGRPGAVPRFPCPAEGCPCTRSSPGSAKLQGEADVARAEAEALKLQARLEDLNVWQMEKVKQSRKGCKTYTYWMTSWS